MEDKFSGILTVKFLEFDVRQEATFYKVLVSDTMNHVSWSLEPWRYSTLFRIDKQIRNEYNGLLPDFPPKKWFGNKNVKFVTQRQKALENYLNIILKNVDLEKTKTLKAFLIKNMPNSAPKSNEKSNISKSTKSNNNNLNSNGEISKEEHLSKQRDELVKKIYNNMIETSNSFDVNLDSNEGRSKIKIEALNNLNINAKNSDQENGKEKVEISTILNEEEQDIYGKMKELSDNLESTFSKLVKE